LNLSYKIPGAEGIELHHLYRAMAWLGEKLPEEDQRKMGLKGVEGRSVII